VRTFVLASEDTRAMVLHVISQLPADGKSKIEIKKTASVRSLAQNNLYRLWVSLIASELGYTHAEMHAAIIQELAAPKISVVLGKEVEVWPSTTRMTVGEMSDLLNGLDVLATNDWHVKLPYPPDDYNLAMKPVH